MEGTLQHAKTAFVAGLQATGAGGNLGPATGAWRCGKRYAFPTSPHPRLRLRTNIQRGVTLTFRLVQKIGHVSRGQQLGTRISTVWTLSQALGQAKKNKYALEPPKGYTISHSLGAKTEIPVKEEYEQTCVTFILPSPWTRQCMGVNGKHQRQ